MWGLGKEDMWRATSRRSFLPAKQGEIGKSSGNTGSKGPDRGTTKALKVITGQTFPSDVWTETSLEKERKEN